MSSYYAVRIGDRLDVHKQHVHDTLSQAQATAEGLKKSSGADYSIFKVDWVWTTQTVADLKRQGAI